jgi:glycosyltransferase involved in cell wall biosynthesis
VDAIDYLLHEIWPLVLERLPNVTLSIAGEGLPEKQLAGNPRNVRYVGHVPDLHSWFDGLRLTVAPLRYGAGAKGKVVSSLAAGVPCVATAIAAEGMRLQDGAHIALGNTPESFAARICEIHENRCFWASLSSNGYDKAQSEHSVKAGEERMAALLRTLGSPC